MTHAARATRAARAHLFAGAWHPAAGLSDRALGIEESEDWGGCPARMAPRDWAELCRAAVRSVAASKVAAS